jgi:hypothetical protein
MCRGEGRDPSKWQVSAQIMVHLGKVPQNDGASRVTVLQKFAQFGIQGVKIAR